MRLSVSSIAAISALALVAFTTPVLAQQQPSAPAQQTSASQTTAGAKTATTPAKPALICRSQVTTGSLLPVRECHTAEQWADIRVHGNNQLGVEAMRHSLNGSTN